MEKIIVETPTSKVIAHRYSENVILIWRDRVPDSDSLIITDDEGYRYKRKITTAKTMYFEFWRI